MYYLNETESSEPDIPATNRFKLTPGNLVGGENGWLSIIGWEKYGNLIKDFYKPSAMVWNTQYTELNILNWF